MTVAFRPVFLGIGTSLPEKIVDNDELTARFPQTNVESFLKITGIRERRVISEGQSASDLAVYAAEALFQTGVVDKSEIDALVYSSLTADYRTPTTSCILQNRLGLSNKLLTFDLVQACPAFTHELATTFGLMNLGVAKTVLAIHSDTLSQLVNPCDRELAPIHGDGAVALLYRTGGANDGGATPEWFAFGTDGAQADRIVVPEGMSRKPFGPDSLQTMVDENGSTRRPIDLKMDGAAVFHFVVHTIPNFLKNACAENGTSLDEYDLILFHQANKMIVEMLYNMLKIPPTKRFYYLEKVGNMSGVALPFMLAEAIRANKLTPGAKVLLCGFGAGLSWGAVSLRWQTRPCVVSETATLPVDLCSN